uniref:Uncharacterized protein n=1 Tax=Salix viminalis TaxID=40686 RepID=A0A6N2NJK3_SALVM
MAISCLYSGRCMWKQVTKTWTNSASTAEIEIVSRVPHLTDFPGFLTFSVEGRPRRRANLLVRIDAALPPPPSFLSVSITEGLKATGALPFRRTPQSSKFQVPRPKVDESPRPETSILQGFCMFLTDFHMEDGKRAHQELPLCFYSPSQTFLLKQIAQKSDHPLKR